MASSSPFGAHGFDLCDVFVGGKLLIFFRIHAVEGYFTFRIVVDAKSISFGEGRGAHAGLAFREKSGSGAVKLSFTEVVALGIYCKDHIIGSEFVRVLAQDFKL